MDKSWQRLVVCKELIHILDPDYALTNTRKDVANLIKRMALPIDLQALTNNQELNDRFGQLQALAVLFPRAARNLLLEPYNAKKITSKEIAALAEIPVHYVAFLMSDEWEKIYSLLLTDVK
jgi:hypothetical protein